MIDEIKNIVKQSYLALLIGAIGGLFASTINMPLPWLLGPLLSNLLLSFTKIKITFSKKLLNFSNSSVSPGASSSDYSV